MIYASAITLNIFSGSSQIWPTLRFNSSSFISINLQCSLYVCMFIYFVVVVAQSLGRCLILLQHLTLQAPLSMGFPRQEYWSGLPFPSPGIFPTQGSNPHLLPWQVESLPLSHQNNPSVYLTEFNLLCLSFRITINCIYFFLPYSIFKCQIKLEVDISSF